MGNLKGMGTKWWENIHFSPTWTTSNQVAAAADTPAACRTVCRSDRGSAARTQIAPDRALVLLVGGAGVRAADGAEALTSSLMFDNASPEAREALASRGDFRITNDNFARWRRRRTNLRRVAAVRHQAGLDSRRQRGGPGGCPTGIEPARAPGNRKGRALSEGIRTGDDCPGAGGRSSANREVDEPGSRSSGKLSVRSAVRRSGTSLPPTGACRPGRGDDPTSDLTNGRNERLRRYGGTVHKPAEHRRKARLTRTRPGPASARHGTAAVQDSVRNGAAWLKQ